MREHDDYEPHHMSSPTDHVLTELKLYGYRPLGNTADQRPLPDQTQVTGAIADIFDVLLGVFAETCLEPDLDDILWSTVNIFHRASERIARGLDGARTTRAGR